MNPAQVKTIQTARRRLKLDEAGYRLILRNTGKVASCKDLTNAAFEQVMAVFEGMGFCDNKKGPTYWRDKASGAGVAQSSADRQRHMVRRLAEQMERYRLPALILDATGERTDDLDDLNGGELYRLIETLKGIVGRQVRQARQGKLFDSTPAAEGSAAGAATEGPARTPATVRDDDEETGDMQGSGDDDVPF